MHSRLVSLVKLTLLHETEMNPRYQLASTLNIQEQVLSMYKKGLMSALRTMRQASGKDSLRAGHADPSESRP